MRISTNIVVSSAPPGRRDRRRPQRYTQKEAGRDRPASFWIHHTDQPADCRVFATICYQVFAGVVAAVLAGAGTELAPVIAFGQPPLDAFTEAPACAAVQVRMTVPSP
jgi:hypothetical protein